MGSNRKVFYKQLVKIRILLELKPCEGCTHQLHIKVAFYVTSLLCGSSAMHGFTYMRHVQSQNQLQIDEDYTPGIMVAAKYT